ncbi:hypothetical protein [Sphingomonas rubra]|uniref:Uncharacterized protein n=1 Tax=Sphingomonas rubra TaxID=634430 RepID=A0A1I5S6W9_9SPHN|nr:hypothetical protein [Sphingomonas rubra]SFP66459.1 hypothetical protein SAMN04488241_10511 [Sphingomonas rubra]
MKNYKTKKTIAGMDADEYLTNIIGPMSATILEQLLTKWLASNGEGMTGPELKMVQFAIERSYGAATRKVEHLRVSDQEIAAEQLGSLDPETLRKIAAANGKRNDGPTIN